MWSRRALRHDGQRADRTLRGAPPQRRESVAWPRPRPRRTRTSPRARRSARSTSSASCATSTSRCTCRCATRTRRGSCRSPHCATATPAQVEGVVTRARIEFRPRRQLVVRLRRRQRRRCVLRFLHFYPTQQKALAGARACACAARCATASSGCEMVHPQFKAVDEGTPLADRADAGLPDQRAAAAGLPAQGRGRRAGARRRWPSCCRRARVPAGLPSLREALHCLHHPPPGVGAGRARGPQPPGLAAAQVRGAAGAAAVAAAGAARARARSARRRCALQAGGLHERAARRAAVRADRGAAARRARDRAPTSRARDADAPAAAGRRRLGQDGGRRAGRGRRDRRRLAVRADGADRDPRRAALPQARRLARRRWASTVAWLTGSRKGKARATMLGAGRLGEAALVVGTHALIQDDVRVRAARPGDRRRAAPLRRRAAAGAARASWPPGAGAAPC